mgnify:CR=1 FL=1
MFRKIELGRIRQSKATNTPYHFLPFVRKQKLGIYLEDGKKK